MQNLIYPPRTVAFSQLENEAGHSHYRINAVDMIGEDTGEDVMYAPCDVIVLHVDRSASSSHTVYFGSCDKHGRPAKVACADMKARVVTIAMTHMDSVAHLKEGQRFKSGDICYKEGRYMGGKNKCGAHCHIEVGEGWAVNKTEFKEGGKTYLRFTQDLRPTDVFYCLSQWTNIRWDKLQSANHDRYAETHWIGSRGTAEEGGDFDMRLRMYTAKGVQAIRQTIEFTKSGSKYVPAGKILAKVPKGNKEAIITGMIEGIQKDGYQWVSVDWNGIVGFAQWDSAYFEALEY